jgi:hypothetical protein
MSGGDPVGEDGLAEPVKFRTPWWFTILIILAVIGAVSIALFQLL